jgi:site-specific recombinase XerC
VFVSERSAPMAPKSFHALIQRLGERAGIPFAIHPHMLRHGCGFALANKGHDTRALQAWLGHRNIRTRCVIPSWRLIGSGISGEIQFDLYPALQIESGYYG